MMWRVLRVTPEGPVEIGQFEGTTVADAIRLAKASGAIEDASAIGLQVTGVTDPERPLSDITLGEFASLLGLHDVIAARQFAHDERVKTEQAHQLGAQLLADIKGLQSVNMRERLTTAHDVDVFAASAKHGLEQGQGKYALVLMLAWVDDRGEVRATMGPVN